MANKITTLLDLDTKAFKSGLKDFHAGIKEADGLTGKFKAGWQDAMSGLKAYSAEAAAAAGVALVAFSVKSVAAFTSTAKAAIDLSTSTGLAVEEASRWIAVGDDYNVTAEALATGLGKVTKTLNSDKWAKYGIATHDAAGNTRSVNDILLDTFETLSLVGNATDQARIGQELFGKGYQSLTPLLGRTRAEYEKMLAAQMKGQVITAEEAARAEATRLAFDELRDSVKEISLALGQYLAPAAAEAAEKLAVVNDAIDKLDAIKVPAIVEWMPKLIGWTNPIGKLGKAITGELVDGVKKLGGVFGIGSDEADGFTAALDGTATKSQDLVQASIDLAEAQQDGAEAVEHYKDQQSDYVLGLQDAGREQEKLTESTDRQREADEKAERQTRERAEALAEQRRKTEDLRQANIMLVGGEIAVEQSQIRAKEAAIGLGQALADAGEDADAQRLALLNVTQAQLDAATSAVDFKIKQAEAAGGTVDATQKSQWYREELEWLRGAVEPGSPLWNALGEYIGQLEAIPRNITTTLTVNGKKVTAIETAGGDFGGFRVGAGEIGIGAHGGIVNRPTLALIGEAGPEAVVPLNQTAGNGPLPRNGFGASNGTVVYLTVNAGMGTDGVQVGRKIKEALDAYYRAGGSR